MQFFPLVQPWPSNDNRFLQYKYVYISRECIHGYTATLAKEREGRGDKYMYIPFVCLSLSLAKSC